ncbi:MAG TPA: phosphorylase [Polyangia bacterium]|nr:phosphorylase [Polyangia bacterium]
MKSRPRKPARPSPRRKTSSSKAPRKTPQKAPRAAAHRAGHTLVVSAWEPEVAPLRSLIAARGEELAGHVTLMAVGVGVVDAAAGAAAAIARLTPDEIVFVGTAGVYPSAAPAHAIGEAAVAGELRLVSTAALRGDAYTPAPLVASAVSTPALAARLRAGLGAEPSPLALVACPLAITQTEELAARLGATGAALENLEAFAVARAAAAAGVPFAAVLGVSNQVGPRAHSQWRANHLAASRAACHVVWRALKS